MMIMMIHHNDLHIWISLACLHACVCACACDVFSCECESALNVQWHLHVNVQANVYVHVDVNVHFDFIVDHSKDVCARATQVALRSSK